jgi:two-component system sensor kinase FixL
MSSFSHLLKDNVGLVLSVFSERLGKAVNPVVYLSDGGEALVDVLCAVTDDGDQAAARDWIESLGEFDCPKLLTTLSCFEWAVRFLVVRHASQRKDILDELAHLASGMDVLRLCCAEVVQSRGSERNAGDSDLAAAFRAVVEHGPDIVCLTTMQGKPVYLNRAGRRLVGIGDGNGLALTSLHDYMADRSWEELRDVGVPAVKRSGRWEGRGQLKRPGSSEEIDVATAAFFVRGDQDEQKPHLAVVHRLAGAEAQLEEALEESEARKHAILESSLDPIITIDCRGVITEFNRAAEQVFGWRREEVLGTKPSEILFPASKTVGHQNRIDRYLNAGEGSLLSKRTEVVAVRASGLPFEAELTMTISQERGMPVLTFFVRDISARKRAEEEQRRYAQDLERSNRELEQFAYVASHDLQEPLRKIRTFGDRLETQCGEALDEMGKQCLVRMKSAAERMQALINGLLTLSRVTTKATDFSAVHLNKIAQEVAGDLEVKIEKCGAKVAIGRLPTIQADPLQMRQLLQNLVGNALKFQQEGVTPLVEVKGNVLQSGDRLVNGDFAERETCRIIVKDNGIGFDEKYLDRIFDVFQRLHPRDVHEGTGVGLAICRKIVDRHDGTITAKSRPNEGATFVVELPVRQEKKRG